MRMQFRQSVAKTVNAQGERTSLEYYFNASLIRQQYFSTTAHSSPVGLSQFSTLPEE